MFTRNTLFIFSAVACAFLVVQVDSEVNAQRRPFQIGGSRGVVIGGGMGLRIGGQNGVQFGGGEGTDLGLRRRGFSLGEGRVRGSGQPNRESNSVAARVPNLVPFKSVDPQTIRVWRIVLDSHSTRDRGNRLSHQVCSIVRSSV